MNSLETMQRVDALVDELARLVRAHTDSLPAEDADKIGYLASTHLLAISLLRHEERETGRSWTAEELVEELRKIPFGAAALVAVERKQGRRVP
jgi:hypothetical protein